MSVTGSSIARIRSAGTLSSVGCQNSSGVPLRSDRNTTRRPSGLQSGFVSMAPSVVKRTSPPRDSSDTQMSSLPPSRITTAMRPPSGERASS